MSATEKTKIIFDTDIGGDCDDAGALAMLHRLCDLGEAVTLAATGSMASLARLAQSPADDISPLTGKELIEQKVLRTVVMGGRFLGSWPMPVMVGDYAVRAEWNIKADIPASQILCREWPGELIFSSYEIGLWCVTMRDYVHKAPQDDPVRRAYELHPCGRQYGRESWDHTALLYAVRPDAGYWNLHPFGRVTVDDEGVTDWHPEEGGRQSYLLPREDYETVRQIIDNLVLPQ